MDKDYIVDPIIKVVCIGDKAIEYSSHSYFNHSTVISMNSNVEVDSEDIKELLKDTDLVIIIITESMIDVQIGMKTLSIARNVSRFVVIISVVPFHLQLSKYTPSVNNYLNKFQYIDMPIFQVDTNSKKYSTSKGIKDTVRAVSSFIMPQHKKDIPIYTIDTFNSQCYCEYKLISALKYSRIDGHYLSLDDGIIEKMFRIHIHCKLNRSLDICELAESLQTLYDALPERIEASFSVETTLSIPIDEVGTTIFACYAQMTNNYE